MPALRSWKIRIRHPRDGYKYEDMVTSGGYYPKYETLYIIARTKKSAEQQARIMVGWSEDTTGKVTSIEVLEVLMNG